MSQNQRKPKLGESMNPPAVPQFPPNLELGGGVVLRAAGPDDSETARLFEEQLYWEDYWERNADDDAPNRKPGKRRGSVAASPVAPAEYCEPEVITDDDVPF